MNAAKQWEIDLIFYHILSHPDNEDLFLWDEKLTGDETFELNWAKERDAQDDKPSGFDWGWPIKGEE